MSEGQEILNQRYRVIRKLGGGGFGVVYEVHDSFSRKNFAAKVEKLAQGQKHCCLYNESYVIDLLRGKTQVPKQYYFGYERTNDGQNHSVMVMDLLGKSLEDMFEQCKRKFDLKTCLHIAV